MLFGIFSLLCVVLPTIMGQTWYPSATGPWTTTAPWQYPTTVAGVDNTTAPECQSCYDDFNPVCAVQDGIRLTFANECELRRYNCKTYKNLYISSGPCIKEYIEQTVQRLLRQQQQPGHFPGPRPNRRTRFGPWADRRTGFGRSRAQNFQMFFKK